MFRFIQFSSKTGQNRPKPQSDWEKYESNQAVKFSLVRYIS